MNQVDELDAALDACRPRIARDHVERVTRLHGRMVADLGPGLPGVTESFAHARAFRNVVSPFIVSVDAPGESEEGAHQVLDATKLQAAARQLAQDVIAEWRTRIIGKMGEVEVPTVSQTAETSFGIVGRKNGHEVRIEQGVILNVSSNGRLFRQFPARIYIDGKFRSEAAYRRLRCRAGGRGAPKDWLGAAPARPHPERLRRRV